MQQLGQQPGPSSVVQQPEHRSTAQEGITGTQPEENENTKQVNNVEEDEPVPPTLSDEQRGGIEMWLTQVKNPEMENNREGEAVPTDVVSAGGGHAGPSGRLEESQHGDVNPEGAEREVRKKRRGRGK